MRRLTLSVSVAVVLALTPGRAQSPAPQQAPSTFRAGIDVVQMDVSVLDKDRRPVKGLTAAEFTVLEEGRPQPIVEFEAVDIADAETTGADWMRTASHDVVDNRHTARRVVVIVLDDSHIPLEKTNEVRRIAREVVERLGPDDLAAVTVTNYGKRQDITSDRARLMKAIDAFWPHPRDALACRYRGKYRSQYACVVDTLVTAADALRDAPQGRKTLVYVSSGAPFFPQFKMADSIGGGVPWGEEVLAVNGMLDSLQRANVNVYSIDPSGVTMEGIMGPRLDSLRMFAEETGGRATIATNTPWDAVPQIFRENGSYYTLGFRPGAVARDGTFQRVEVRVNRPDLEVRTRSGYFAADGRNAVAAGTANPLDKAIARSVPGGDLRFSTTAVPFAQPGQKHAAVAIATLLREPLGSEPRDVEIATMALDSDCGDCRKLPSTRQVIRFPPGPSGAQPEVLTRMALAPGSYEIRVAASAAAGAGSVIAHLDVPNFQKDQLSASGLVITARGGIVTGEQNPVADLLPVVPTALRDIDRAIEASAFVRIYQIGARRPSPVQVTATIRDAADTSAFNETTLLEAAAFGSSKTTDYRLVLPVRQLTPGAYLLTIDAVAGKRTVKRETRFQVK